MSSRAKFHVECTDRSLLRIKIFRYYFFSFLKLKRVRMDIYIDFARFVVELSIVIVCRSDAYQLITRAFVIKFLRI